MKVNIDSLWPHVDARQHFLDDLHKTAKPKAKIKLIAEDSYLFDVVVVVVLETCAIIPRDVVSEYVARANMAFR